MSDCPPLHPTQSETSPHQDQEVQFPVAHKDIIT